MDEQFALLPNAWWKTPYLFNGNVMYADRIVCELDSRTSLYYYSTRYYDPGLSVWLSVDPLAEKYATWTPYNYTMQNPVKFIDPTGMSTEGNDWIPKYDEANQKIFLVAEPGDNQQSLKEWANGAFSDEEVSNLYKNKKDGKIDLTNTFVGKFAAGYEAESAGCEFNCFSAVESGLSGDDKESGYGRRDESQFLKFVSMAGFVEKAANEKTRGDAQPFKSAFGYSKKGEPWVLDHVSINAGKDRSGTSWILTKDGYPGKLQFQKRDDFYGQKPDRVYQKTNRR